MYLSQAICVYVCMYTYVYDTYLYVYFKDLDFHFIVPSTEFCRVLCVQSSVKATATGKKGGGLRPGAVTSARRRRGGAGRGRFFLPCHGSSWSGLWEAGSLVARDSWGRGGSEDRSPSDFQ